MNIEEELVKLICLSQNEQAELRGGDRDYYRAAKKDTEIQKELIIKYVSKIEEAVSNRDPYYFSDREEKCLLSK